MARTTAPSKKNMAMITKKRRATSSTKTKNTQSVPHAPKSVLADDNFDFDMSRTKLLTTSSTHPREKKNLNSPCIVYWMLRDVRTVDNHALLFAQSLAVKNEVPLRVVYSLLPPPSEDPSGGEDGAPPSPADMSMTLRHGTFLIDGLKVVSDELMTAKVPFDILLPSSRGSVGSEVVNYCTGRLDTLALVCDMSPLRMARDWIEKQTAPNLRGIPLYQVDAHNIVPVWVASQKREVGARTLRPKINSHFSSYCTHFPVFTGNDHLNDVADVNNSHDWDIYMEYMQLDESIAPVPGFIAGHEAAMVRFREFCTSKHHGLGDFDKLRNDPNYETVTSNLSPWINHGQVSFQRLALNVRALKKHSSGTAAYIEEGVVRRELSDNFVYYTPDGYDSLSGAADWARDSLELHQSDEREFLYSWKQLERAETHDDLWNAAQLQLTREGVMHGFMRMYWCKKILEWTQSPSYALATAQYLNDRYSLDGNDPNGFVGVGWSIMGIHDMGWKERNIFGKIRYMNYAGCKRKFKVETYVSRFKGASQNAKKALATSGKKLSGTKRKALIE